MIRTFSLEKALPESSELVMSIRINIFFIFSLKVDGPIIETAWQLPFSRGGSGES